MHCRLLQSYTFRPHGRPFNWSATRPYTGGGLNFVLCARAKLFIWNYPYVKFCNQTLFCVFSLKWKIKILRLRGLHFLLTKLPQRTAFPVNQTSSTDCISYKPNFLNGLHFLLTKLPPRTAFPVNQTSSTDCISCKPNFLNGLHFLLTKLPQRNLVFSTNSSLLSLLTDRVNLNYLI